jgi:hypothetical protein
VFFQNVYRPPGCLSPLTAHWVTSPGWGIFRTQDSQAVIYAAFCSSENKCSEKAQYISDGRGGRAELWPTLSHIYTFKCSEKVKFKSTACGQKIFFFWGESSREPSESAYFCLFFWTSKWTAVGDTRFGVFLQPPPWWSGRRRWEVSLNPRERNPSNRRLLRIKI